MEPILDFSKQLEFAKKFRKSLEQENETEKWEYKQMKTTFVMNTERVKWHSSIIRK